MCDVCIYTAMTVLFCANIFIMMSLHYLPVVFCNNAFNSQGHIISLDVHNHDDVTKWNHFLRYWPLARGLHRSLANSAHKGQWWWALMFSLIWVWTYGWVNNRDAGDLRRYRVHYDVTVTYMNAYDCTNGSTEHRKWIWYFSWQWF